MNQNKKKDDIDDEMWSECGLGSCDKVVGKDGIQCESCYVWFHVDCAGLNAGEYKMLKKRKKNIHWFCEKCDDKIMDIVRTINDVKIKSDKLERELNELKSEVNLKPSMDEVKELVSCEIEKMVKALQIRETEENKMDWNEAVTKEIDNKLSNMTEKYMTHLTEAQDNMLEFEDKQKRKNNVIIYNVEEISSENMEERIDMDRNFCGELMNSVLKIGYENEDIKKIIRLGKRGENNSKRPMLVEFRNLHVKNLVMESAYKVGKAKDKFKGIVISQDMTKREREQCKQMVEEAKIKQVNDDSGLWNYKVRGPPGQMKVLRLKK